MRDYRIGREQIDRYAAHLRREERSPGTVENYLRHARTFAAWLNGRPVTRERAAEWKEHLLSKGCAPVTVNAMLAALNGLFRFLGWDDCRVKFLKLQRRLFRATERELTRAEYDRLLSAAQTRGRERLALLMETICATGIRVSEVPYITVEAAQAGTTSISLKGKVRTILLPGKLCRRLLRYARSRGISTGPVFRTHSGRPLSRTQIWAEMKRLCQAAGVAASRVFPHNLRHLFARTFYGLCQDIVKLADILGHSSIDTTRIYLRTTGAEHIRQMERLHLLC